MNIIQQANMYRFIVDIKGAADDKVAKLEYEFLDNKTIHFTHTYVPFSLRGKGHAEALVNTGLAWAAVQKFNVQTSCWYVAKFLDNKPQT